MADISSYLAAIMAAVYGEDVRGSIHDAIDIINKVGEVVLNTGTAVTGPTSSSTGFYDGSFYINTNTMELWKCIGTNAWQSQGVLKGADGADGNGIVSIVKTATVGLVDTYTITFDDGSTETYQITNGQNGSKWYKGTAISGTGTSITGFPGTKDDFYLNSVDGYVYVCTKTGGAMVPDAAEWDYVMTLTGGGGGSITVIDNLISTSSTDALSANQGRVLNTNKIDNPSTKSDGQVLTYNATDDEWEARNATGGGLLPILPIASEATATVTVIQDSTGNNIPVASAGSGHWICEIPEFGYYTIHSVLAGQGDATQRVYIDEVKVYDEVTDNHYDHTIRLVAPSGSTVRVTDGSESRTETGTDTTQDIIVHNSGATYSVTVELDGNTKPTGGYSVTTPSTSGQTTTIPSGTFDFGTINVSVAADFVTAGASISCVSGGTSCTPKTAASTLVFRVPTTGTWTISGSVSGQTYTTTVTVTALGTPVSTSLQTVPDGSTVLPTDDISTWLACGGLSGTGYTTLSQVLADSTTLLALMSDNNAVDYLVRSTTWATDVCADSTAMTDIGANNYCADTLLADSDWFDGIFNSTYMSSVLNVYVPTLSADSSDVIESSYDSATNKGWHAFDGSSNTGWYSNNETSNQYIGYDFGRTVDVYGAQIDSGFDGTKRVNDFKIQGSVDKFVSDTNDIYTGQFTNPIKTPQKYTFNKASYSSFRFFIINANAQGTLSIAAMNVQFWGREDV